ncbi:MAG: prolyl oligopeptidase family serine peptidase [Pseudomonadota bacterium]
MSKATALAIACLGLLMGLETTASDAVEESWKCESPVVSGVDTATVEQVTLAAVPALLRVPARMSMPPVVLWHGFGPPGDKHALMSALPLDDVPAAKIYLDLPLFGERTPQGGLAELARRQQRDYGLEVFAPVVTGAVDELPAVIKALEAKLGEEWGEEVSLFGFSAGGAAVLLTLAENKVRVRDAIVLNAPNGLRGGVSAYESAVSQDYAWSAEAEKIADQTDAVRRAEEIARENSMPSLLLIHGKDDELIPYESSVQIHASLKPHYKSASAPLHLELMEGLDHHWTGSSKASVVRVRTKVSEWLRCHTR